MKPQKPITLHENASLPNRHTAYVAKSGGGKSQALKQNRDIPRSKVRLLAWDPNKDHGKHCTLYSASQLAKYHAAIVAGMKSRKGFRIGLIGDQNQDFFERWFCKLALACLDGDVPLYILVEEVAKVQRSASKLSENFSLLLDQSRKYNGVIHWTSQFPSSVPTDLLRGTENYYIGHPGKFSTPEMNKRLASTAECSIDELTRLKPLSFYKANTEESQLITLKYKDI